MRVADFDFDLAVVGAGSGGVRASRTAAGLGARVAVVERGALGGTCVNLGCIPKKLFSYAAHFHQEFRDARGFGWDVDEPRFDWPRLRDNKTREIERLNGIYDRLLQNAGVTLVRGSARLEDPHSLRVELNGGGEQRISARHILLAPGGRPWVPEFPGREHVLVSDDLFSLPELPRSAAVVGGGYIAVEFAGILNGLGVDTRLLYRGELFLRGFDHEVREILAEEMRAKGVTLSFNTRVEGINRREDGRLALSLDNGETQVVDAVFYATGRVPLLEPLGLEQVPLALTPRGHIAVDDDFQTSVPSVYAIGDVTGGLELTPVALAQAMAVARTLALGEPTRVDLENVPTAVFSQPNVASVGHTEESARTRFGEISVFTTRFRGLKHTLTDNTERSFMKLIVDQASDRVVGVHMVGPEAGEIVQGLAVAVKAGATKAVFDATVGIHPTAAEEFVTLRQPSRH